MSFALSEDEQLLQESALGYFSGANGIPKFRDLRANDDVLAADIWAGIQTLGLSGLIVSEEAGGAKMGTTAACVIADIIGQNLTLVPYISSSLIAPKVISELATDSQKKAWLPALVEGRDVSAIAIDMPALQLVPTGEGYKLKGVIDHIIDGGMADYLIVKTELGNNRYIVRINLNQDGIARKTVSSLDGRDMANITLDNVSISKSDIVGEVPVTKHDYERIFAFAAIIYSAELVGSSRAAFDMTLAYLKERKQFGKIIGSFQALQHRTSILFLELSQAEALTIKAAKYFDNRDKEFLRYASLAKAKAGQAARLITNEAVQLHGGIGVTDEYDIGFFMKHVAVSERLYGDYSFHADKAACLVGY